MVRTTVPAGMTAVVRIDETPVEVLAAGRHKLPRAWPGRRSVELVRNRREWMVLAGQELAAADVPGVRVVVAAQWRVTDPVAFLDVAVEPLDGVRLALQLALRDAVATRELEAVVAERAAIGAELLAAAAPAAAEVGVGLLRAELRDVTMPAEVRRAVLAVHTARADGLAALERARGETAALRALANGAKTLADNPALLQLRTAQEVARAGGSVKLELH